MFVAKRKAESRRATQFIPSSPIESGKLGELYAWKIVVLSDFKELVESLLIWPLSFCVSCNMQALLIGPELGTDRVRQFVFRKKPGCETGTITFSMGPFWRADCQRASLVEVARRNGTLRISGISA